MFGTGESASSSSESMIPSWISSSCTVGTYWFHMGSPTSLIWSRAAGVMRIWKLSNAGASASTSMTSRPNRSASLSRLAMLSSLRIRCHSLIVIQLPARGGEWEKRKTGKGNGKRRHGVADCAVHQSAIPRGEQVERAIRDLRSHTRQSRGECPTVIRRNVAVHACVLAHGADQRAVVQAGHPRHAREPCVGRDVGIGVHFEDPWTTLAINAHVHAPVAASAHQRPRGERDLADLARELGRELGGTHRLRTRVFVAPGLPLGPVRHDAPHLLRHPVKEDLGDREHLVAHDADVHLAAIYEPLYQDLVPAGVHG